MSYSQDTEGVKALSKADALNELWEEYGLENWSYKTEVNHKLIAMMQQEFYRGFDDGLECGKAVSEHNVTDSDATTEVAT